MNLSAQHDFSLMASGVTPEFIDGMGTPAMPILMDVPTRSRKLLEDLGSSPVYGNGVTSPSFPITLCVLIEQQLQNKDSSCLIIISYL